MDAPGRRLTSEEAAEVVAAAAPYLESWLALQREQLRVPGVQAAVRVGGRLVLSAALGTADASTGEPLTREHVFRVASTAKWFTATAVLRLVDAGRLRLDDALGHWVPQLTERAPDVAAVTVRQALGHTGGVARDARDSDYWQLLRPFPDVEGVLAIAADGQAASGTDEQFAYSNTAYALLGLVVEAATGTPCAGHVQRDVVDRLGLTRTTTEPGPATGPVVAGHTALLAGETERLVIPSARTATGAMAPAAGLTSTAEDLARFGASSWTGPGLLSAASERLQRRRESVLSAHGEESRAYGLGVELHTLRGRELLGHAGGWPGQISRTFVDPKAQLAVSVLTNAVDGPADALARGLLALVDLALAGAERRTGAAAREDADLARRTGRFANPWQVVDVALLGGRLLLLRPTDPDPHVGHDELELVDGVLRSGRAPDFGSGSRVVEQVRDAAGAVQSVRVGGVSHWPLEVFRARRAEQVAGDAGSGVSSSGAAISRTAPEDAGELLTLQRAAYATEARLYGDPELPALTQTLPELQTELASATALKATVGHRIVGAVRATVEGSVLHVGRLTVAPDWQGRGIGSALLAAVETHHGDQVETAALFTGHLSAANLALYARRGYVEQRREPLRPGVVLVHLAKPLTRQGSAQ